MMDKPRDHHLQMKYLLARMAIQDPERFFATFGAGGDPAYLVDLWIAFGQRFPKAEQIPSAGVGTRHHPSHPGPEMLVIVLPPAIARNEAHFIGVVRTSPTECRVFCLESTMASDTGAAAAVLAEIAADGRRNWGVGGEPVVEAFVALIGRVLSDPSAEPATFIPMQLA